MKRYERVNLPVVQTVEGMRQFPGEPMGTLVYRGLYGRWAIRRNGQRRTCLWRSGWWRTLRKAETMADVMRRLDRVRRKRVPHA
jgi:hypothetical protein